MMARSGLEAREPHSTEAVESGHPARAAAPRVHLSRGERASPPWHDRQRSSPPGRESRSVIHHRVTRTTRMTSPRAAESRRGRPSGGRWDPNRRSRLVDGASGTRDTLVLW